jgi:putative ABC transport system permease protein
VLLIVSTITVVSQTQHLVDAPLGYNTKNIIYIANPYHTKLLEAAADEIRKLASVKRVAFASGTPLEKGGNYWTILFGDKAISVQILVGDSAYVDMLGIKIPRDNHQEGVYYFRQTAMKEFGLADDALMAESQYTKARVGGIIQDVRTGNILDDVRPVWFKYRR